MTNLYLTTTYSPKEVKFKAAERRYTSTDQVDGTDLERWLEKSRKIQWDYKNIVKRKGQLERLIL